MSNYFNDGDYLVEYESPIGVLRIVSDGTSIKGVLFASNRLKFLLPKDGAELACVKSACRWLDAYFSGEIPDFLPPLDYHGVTPFTAEVLAEIALVPYGATVSYGYIAKRIAERRGTKMSAQAVGGALNRNPIGIFLPCHRVVGADGALVGFGGGLGAKRFLLALEKCCLVCSNANKSI